MRVLVTGANGFVGSAVVPSLRACGHAVIAVTRGNSVSGVETRRIDGLGPATDWKTALRDVDTVVHLAARVHIMRDDSADPEAAFWRVNVDGTRRLAEAAAASGVRRLLFVSTTKVNGERTPPDRPFRVTDPPAPEDAYGRSKWRAEQALAEVSDGGRLEVVVLRPPLVYGPGVGANFLALLKLCDGRWPLPFGGLENRRSLSFVGNLADAIAVAIAHPDAAGATFLVSDGPALSVTDLIRRLRRALHRPARLVPLPPAVLRLAGGAVGRAAHMGRLLDSAVVDAGAITERLGWRPPVGVDDGLAATVRAYRGG